MGVANLDLSKILERGMIPVVRKRNIVKARLLPRSEQGANGIDIILTSPSGVKTSINRKTLISRYTYLNGGKISLAGWRSSKEYTVCALDNTNGLAMLVPLRYKLKVNGRIVNGGKRKVGDYIVVDVGEDGRMIQDTIGVLPSSLFKKMYYIPPNEIINRHSRHRKSQFNNQSTASCPATKPNNVKEAFDFGDSDIYKQHDMHMEKSTINYSKPVIDKQQYHSEPKTNQSDNSSIHINYKYIAVGRLINSRGELVGFVIQTKDGKSTNITKEQMINACKKKLVSNIMVATRPENGAIFLRGNNIRIENLPSYRI